MTFFIVPPNRGQSSVDPARFVPTMRVVKVVTGTNSPVTGKGRRRGRNRLASGRCVYSAELSDGRGFQILLA